MRPGARRRELDGTLRAAYGEGLLSHGTFVHRVGELLSTGSVDPRRLVGDLTLRGRRPHRARLSGGLGRLIDAIGPVREDDLTPLLALDWSGATDQLIVGRAERCDVRLDDLRVSRRHARLRFRDGTWMIQDLGSKNGTLLNGRPVIRGQLRPGDRLAFAGQTFRID
jgi:hypothetical protein